MSIKYQIAMIGNQYLIAEMADGIYYFLFDFTEENLEQHPPQLLSQREVRDYYGDEFEFFVDNDDSKEYSSLDIIFREVELSI